MAGSTDAALLELIGDLLGILEVAELREALLVAMDRALPSDFVSINQVGPRPADMYSVIRPALPERFHRLWAQHGHENPLIERFARTRDSRPYRFSDVISQDELHALALYREFYAALGVEHQIAFIVQVSPPLYVGIALSRGARDYSDAERTLLDRARPYLIQIYGAALTHSTLTAQLGVREPTGVAVERLVEAGLTPREATVLAHVARGLSNADIAAQLHISERTVGKHLQRCYGKIGASNRSQAAAIAWGVGQPV
jgi:DNA-binding CsgD family transcriptional regulator